ncbi:hypothetical protein FACS1894109_11150 [Spirochaetia bacterium]|nr:hypothetical protein FACS1894109_11150 [Spirochaetia bacterium]
MEKRVWTARGKVLEPDKAVIRGLVEKNPIASRIFVTGEVHENYIGHPAANMLYAINDVLDEPLFVQTRQETVQMARFEPDVVWRLFHPDILVKLIGEEEERLGVTIEQLDQDDFYQSLTTSLIRNGVLFPKAKVYGSPDTFYQIMYLGCLLLYGKPGYMAVPVSQHFALPETVDFLHSCDYRRLIPDESSEALGMYEKYQDIQGLTNQELNLLVKMYDRDAKQ